MKRNRICVWDKPYRFRMFDPWVRRFDALKPPHQPLQMKLRYRRLVAANTAHRRGPNKHGRHFALLGRDMLEARLCGVSGQIMRGAGR